MSKVRKFWLGILTFLYPFLTILSFLIYFINMINNSEGTFNQYSSIHFYLFAFSSVFSGFINFVLMAHNINHVYQDKTISKTTRDYWVVSLLFLSVFMNLIYYRLMIMNDEEDE